MILYKNIILITSKGEFIPCPTTGEKNREGFIYQIEHDLLNARLSCCNRILTKENYEWKYKNWYGINTPLWTEIPKVSKVHELSSTELADLLIAEKSALMDIMFEEFLMEMGVEEPWNLNSVFATPYLEFFSPENELEKLKNYAAREIN